MAGAGIYGKIQCPAERPAFTWLFRCTHLLSTGCPHYFAINEPRELYDDRTLLESYYSIGIETISSEQVEISIHKTAEEAKSAAGRIAEFLNQESGGRLIGVREVPQIPAKITCILVFAGCWLAIFIGSVFAWELSRQ